MWVWDSFCAAETQEILLKTGTGRFPCPGCCHSLGPGRNVGRELGKSLSSSPQTGIITPNSAPPSVENALPQENLGSAAPEGADSSSEPGLYPEENHYPCYSLDWGRINGSSASLAINELPLIDFSWQPPLLHASFPTLPLSLLSQELEPRAANIILEGG